MESGETAADAGAQPGRGVVEGGGGDAAYFCEEVVCVSWVGGADFGRGEGCAEEVFGWAVVGGCVECADSVGEGAVDEFCCWEGVGVCVVLGVEGCCAHY